MHLQTLPTTCDAPSEGRPRRRLVVHVRTVSGQGGGPEKTILNSPRWYRKFGYRAICIYLHPEKDPGIEALRNRASAAGAHLLPLRDRGPLDVGLLCKLTAICRRLKPDVWHSHDYKSNLLGLAVRRRVRMAMVTTVHGWVQHTARTPLYYAVDKWCLPRYDRVVCVSEDLYQQCRQLGVRDDRCIYVPNAIDTARFSRQVGRREAKQALAAPPEGLLIGAVGRLSPEKGFLNLIRVAAALRTQGKPLTLWIAGEGSQRAELERLITDLNCGDYVKLLGHVADPMLFYQAMDVFVLSSDREGLPNVVLEAMALGTPVLATKVAGVPSLVVSEESGLLVEPGRPEQLRSALERLCDQPELRDRLAAAARERVETQFDFAERTRRVCRVHDDAIASLKNH